MATSKRWALVPGLFLLVLVLAGVVAFVRRPAESAGSPPAPVGFAAAPSIGPSAPPSARSVTDKAASQPAAPPAAVPPVDPPHFDVVRVEPSGDTVVAGKGAPNAKVALIARGAVVAETTADANGHFVVLPPSLVPGDHSLSLRQMPPNGAPSTSAQSVTVVVPARGNGSVVVALAEPGQATKVLSAPDAPPPPQAPPPQVSPQATPPQARPPQVSSPSQAPPVASPAPVATAPVTPAPASPGPAAAANVAVRAVDLENGEGFHASGVAKPGTSLHVYLNNAHIADVVADRDGLWTVTIRKGLAGGHYVVRADAEQPADPSRKAPTVTARAEVPFDVPAKDAVNPPPAVKPPARAPSDAPTAEASASPPDAGKPMPSRPMGQPATVQPSSSPPSTALADAGNVVIDEIQTARVVSGDNLWNISLSRLGRATRYTQIYTANEKQIRDPNLIYPGQVLVLPR